uniref:PH domain-containing protein n=1 Tax=Aquila chrysaetos chrysaetos TaxID=223781 RepID=A0A663E9H9_AQUCH
MARQRDLDKLLSDLRSFLLILDRESLSAAARAKKKSVADLLSRLQSPPSEDAEYMIMRCLSPSPGTPQGRASPGTRMVDGTGGRACECRPVSTLSLRGGSKVPGVSPFPPADDSYEDAEPLGPGRCTGSGGADTDSSHYESYGEDEDGVTDRAHYLRRPPAAGPDAEPLGRPEAQLCGFLWRKRWLGQWAKQLFIVREHVLLCFRCAADPQPVLELDLRGCRVAYKAKRGKKMPHSLKVTGTAGEALVIGFQSRQQAEDWRKVIEEVSSDAPSGLAAISIPASPSSRLGRAAGSQLSREEEKEEEDCSQQSPARSPRPGDDAKGGAARGDLDEGVSLHPVPLLMGDAPAGFLAVRLRGRWQRLWCAVRQGALRMFPEPGGAQRPVCALRLEGCEVSPGAAAGSPQRLRIRIAQRGRELALLQTCSDEEREAWLKTLRARGGGEPAGDGAPTETPKLGDASSCPAAGGLLLRRVPTPNAYMDDPFGQLPPTEVPKHLYSNVERLQQLVTSADAPWPPPPCKLQGEGDGLPPSACPRASPGLLSTAAELGPSSAGAAQETRVCAARRCLQQCPGQRSIGGSSPGQGCQPAAGEGEPRAPEQGSLPVPAHPDAAREERGSGRAGYSHREESLPQTGGEGGAAGEGLPHEGQAESRLRDEPAGHWQVAEGSHRRYRQLGRLRGLIPHAAVEAHRFGKECPEAISLPGPRRKGKSAAEEKGVGDEVCDVTSAAAAPGQPPTRKRTCRTGHLSAERRAARGSCRTSLVSVF